VTCRFAPAHEYLYIAGRNQLTVNARSRPVVFLGKCQRFGSETSQPNEIRELQPLEINLRFHD